MRLADMKIAYKLMMLVAVLSIVIAVVATTGVMGLRTVVEGAQSITASGRLALTAARLNQNTLAMNRAEFRIAADPSAQSVADVSQVIQDQRNQFNDRLSRIKAGLAADGLSDEDRQTISQIDSAYQAYSDELQGTFQDVQRLGSQVQTNEAQKEITKSVLDSRAKAEALIAVVKNAADVLATHADQLSDSALAGGDRTEVIMIAVGLIGIIGGATFGYLLARFTISKPLSESLTCLRQLSTGDSQVEIFGRGRKDEIGDIAGAMETFKSNLIKNAELQEREAAAQIERTRRAELISSLTNSFDHEASIIVKSVAAAATEMQSTATSMTATAEETSRQSAAVAAAAEQTSANVQTVAAASEELSSSVSEISRQVTQSAKMSSDAVRKAEETNVTVVSLTDAAAKIGSVIQLITDIASQTNLLALNATIEAARAGEAGKGFAVVASEVKNLANQTSKATDEIGQQIGAMQAATKEAVDAIGEIKGMINQLNAIASGIASAVEEQGAATQEISRNVQQAAQGTQDVTSNIVSVSQAAGETGAAAVQLLGGASELSQQAEGLKSKVESFLADVRAA